MIELAQLAPWMVSPFKAPLPMPKGHRTSKVIASLSGGKDSTAIALRCIESGIDAEYVFLDTGWELPPTYEYLDLMRQRLGITIHVARATDGGMIEKIRHRAGFPARMQRWCTRELKVQVGRAYHDAYIARTGAETISMVGIRSDESTERAMMPYFAYDTEWEGYVWRPLIHAKVEDVLAIHHRHNMPVNPLYKLGFGRVGCTCIYAGKEEIALTAKHFPERIDLIDSLEVECEDIRRTRNEETPDRYAHEAATFFQARRVDRYEDSREWIVDGRFKRQKGRRCPDQGPPPEGETRPGHWRILRKAVYVPMHIRETVEWANTGKGGRGLPVIREKPTGGCYRWGMCEPPAAPLDDEEAYEDATEE